MNPEQLKTFIDNQVEAAVDMIFNNSHGAAMTTSGDITPEQAFELSKLKEQLQDLIHTQVTQNLPQDDSEELPMRQWNVPVMRTGYSHTLIAVSARTEQEAIDLAINEAGGEDFSEKSSEYEATDGAHLIG